MQCIKKTYTPPPSGEHGADRSFVGMEIQV